MNQLSGKYVNVVLSVECGRGMDFLRNSVHVIGNFNNRILESDKVPAEEGPYFNTELVWEIEKKELRRIRSANQPLRVECITTDPQNRRERAGFALLSLRTAQVIPQKEADQELHFTWHRLIGCQGDKKKCHPELYISLAVRDHLLNELESCNSIGEMPYISEEDSTAAEDLVHTKFPLKYFEDGHIQIGDGDIFTTFHVKLMVMRVVNLDALLPEVLVFQQIRKSCFLSFKLLGIAIKTKTFQKELHDTINLNEKIVVKLMSTREILEEFFRSQSITISFICGTEKLGVTNEDFADVFDGKESKCFFKFPSPNGIVPFNCTDKSPYIHIKTWIEEDSLQNEENIAEKMKPKTVFSNTMKPLATQVQSEETLEVQEGETKNDSVKQFLTKSVEKFIKAVELSPKLPMDNYQKYVVEISFQYLIWKISPPDLKVMFKFLHPKAASCITIFTEISNNIGEQILLNNLSVKIGYVSTATKIQKLLNIWPPRIVLTDEKERCFSEEKDISISCLKDYSIDYEIIIRGLRTLDPLAKIGVKISMKQCDVEDDEVYENMYLLPIILDEIITVREIADLEEWKVKEHESFKKELERLKTAELEKMQNEWNQKKQDLEEKLQKTINKCQELQEELRYKLNNMKTEKSLVRNADNSSLYVSIFKDNWKKFSEDNTKEIIELLSKTQRDNEVLKDMINKQREKIRKTEKSALTKCQTTTLLKDLKVLEEKFEEVQRSKSYFKERWKQAVEEIHGLRTEEIANMQLQIKQSKEELSQLSLDTYSGLPHDDSGDYIMQSSRSLKTAMF